MRDKGFIQVYTGKGKGKTTAALGLAIRAVGTGMKVYFAQFLKAAGTGEGKFLRKMGKKLKYETFGSKSFICGKPETADITAAKKGLEKCGAAIKSGKYDLVVMDEANVAVKFGLFNVEELIEIINSRNPHTEVIITGRNADPKLLKTADLVTEMKEIKHYFKKGVRARKGIEF